MKLNHINLVVADVAKTRAFFETYFGFKCIVEKGPDTLVVLADDAQFFLALSNFGKVKEVVYPDLFHIGFYQSSRARVDEIHKRLKADGFEAPPPKEEHGSYTLYLKSPGGFLVEVAHDSSVENAPSVQ